MKYTAKYIKYDRDYHQPVDSDFKKQFNCVNEALQWQYEHGEYGYDYMIEGVFLTETGEEINVWEYTKPNDSDVEVGY